MALFHCPHCGRKIMGHWYYTFLRVVSRLKAVEANPLGYDLGKHYKQPTRYRATRRNLTTVVTGVLLGLFRAFVL